MAKIVISLFTLKAKSTFLYKSHLVCDVVSYSLLVMTLNILYMIKIEI